MTRPELTDKIAELCDQSGLPLQDKVYALRAALTRVQMNVGSPPINERDHVQPPRGAVFCIDHNDSHVDCPVAVMERQYKAKLQDAAMPPPRPGTEPLTRPPKKLSKRQQAIEARRRSDPIGADRDDIDYGSDELPSAR